MLRRYLVTLGIRVLLSSPLCWAISVAEIQGSSFQSPWAGQTVQDVTGIVTAKDKYGAWILGERSDDLRVSSGLRIYGSSAIKSVSIGDEISVSGRITEYRPAYSTNDLFLTELDLPHDVRILSRGNKVEPLVLGKDRIPPTSNLSVADTGRDSWLSVPGNVTLLESVNPILQPELYGLDFWESLEGEIVTVPAPVALNFPDRFGSVWVHGDWPVEGRNSRGGLTLTFSGEDGTPEAHPGAILIGHPLDNTRNPRTSMGTLLSDITGIVTYQYGSYYVLPLTAPSILTIPAEKVFPSSLLSSGRPCELTIGDYNVENMGPRSHHIASVAEHIVHYLNSPDIVFVQEIQDDSGAKNDGVVSANKTLSALTTAIAKASKGDAQYRFINVEPEDNVDGGKPGGNIRVAYLWRPESVSLVPGSPVGNATQGTEVIIDVEGQIHLSYNPGRIDPLNAAWEEARKPIAAAWQTTSGNRFYTVNVHFSSKRYSSSVEGDARPPINGKSAQRSAQANVTANFVHSLLTRDPDASIIVGGDMNEFLQTRSVFRPFAGLLTDINKVANVPSAERYTYVYDHHAQEIDHIFVSSSVAARGAEVEHVHVNTWAASAGARASDHDPSVAKVWVCAPEPGLGLEQEVDGPEFPSYMYEYDDNVQVVL